MTPDPTAPETPATSAELGMLERLLSIRQEIYGELLQRYEDTRINEQVRANAITIVEPADLARQPSTPRVPLNTALGLVAGLATGVILAFLFEGMDDTLRGIEDVRAITTLPIICEIPRGRQVEPHQSEPFREWSSLANASLPPTARTSASVRQPAEDSIFLITSPEPGAGKSTVAANLAYPSPQGVIGSC